MGPDHAAHYGGRQCVVCAQKLGELLLRPKAARTVLGAGLAVYAALEFWLTRGTTMFIDEYEMFVQNRGLHPSALLAPFNEHLELARRLLYAIALKVVGADGAFLTAKFVQAIGVIALVALVFVFLQRRIGATAALAPSLLLLFFGSAWELDFAISGIGNVFALAAGACALTVLDCRGRRADVAGCALLVVSVLSFTAGVAFAVGALCLFGVRRELRQRMWVALVPLALYAAWLSWVRVAYLPTHPGAQTIALSNVLLIPSMIAQQGAATAGAITGLNYQFGATDPFSVFSTSSGFGALLAAVAGGLLIWRLRRGASPLLWALVATLVVYWIELAVGSGIGRNPTTVRYVYAASVIAILITGEAVSRPVKSARVLLILYCVTAFALVGNVIRLRDGMRFYRNFGTTMRAQLSALEIAAPAEKATFGTFLGSPPFIVATAGQYLQAVHRNGSPAFSQRQLLGQTEAVRAAADAVLVSALRLQQSAPNPSQHASRCHSVSPSSGSAAVFTLGPPGVELTASDAAHLALSRYAPGSPVPVGALPPRGTVELRIPADRGTQSWRATITPAPRLTVCDL